MTSEKNSVSEMANKWENTQYFSICFLKANDYLRRALKYVEEKYKKTEQSKEGAKYKV